MFEPGKTKGKKKEKGGVFFLSRDIEIGLQVRKGMG
jgi:hypothetical protein